MDDNIFCKNCGKELPAESSFCPYCMTKFTKESEIEPDLFKKRSGKKILLIAIAIFLVITVTAVAVLLPRKGERGAVSKESETQQSTSEKEEAFSASEALETVSEKETHGEASFAFDTATGFSGLSDDKALSGAKELVADYFGSELMKVPYGSLNNVYVKSKIKFDCVVLETSDEHLVVEYGAGIGFDGIYEPTGDVAAVKLSDTSRINVSDALTFYAEYQGMKDVVFNGEKMNVPQFSAKRYTDYVYADVEMPLYTESEITAIAKAVFGNDTVVRDAKNSDFVSGIGDVEMNRGMYYTAVVGESKYCFYTGEGRYIYDCGSTFSNETYILPTADMNGYYQLTSYANENKNTVESIGKNSEKRWQREFKLSDLPVIDYTVDHIYLVSDAMLYILDAKTGQDIIRPKYVGEKCDIRKTGDGIVLLSYDRSKALMKTDLSGNVMWTASLSFDLSDSVSGAAAPVFQLNGDRCIIQCEAYGSDGFSVGIYTAVISNDGKVVFEDK